MNKLSVKVSAPRMISFVFSVISANLYNARTSNFADIEERYFSSLLAKLANFIIAIAILEYLRSTASRPDDESTELRLRAAAMTNYLLGRNPAEAHVVQFYLEQEHYAAMKWLQQNFVFQELVVQSIRVMNIVNYAKGNEISASVLEEKVLTTFASSYPSAPNPNSYELLVHRAIKSLPAGAQANIHKIAAEIKF